jgi:predicted Rossmann-fold nucleotide-binding protein
VSAADPFPTTITSDILQSFAVSLLVTAATLKRCKFPTILLSFSQLVKVMAKRVCVFAGSSTGNNPLFMEHAALLGKEIASRGYELVYGGGNVGLMGACCEAHQKAGGKVISVIPEPFLPKEVSGESVGHVFKTVDMHSRKQIMATVSDMFIALPGFAQETNQLPWFGA